MAIEVLRRYKYIGPEYTYIRTRINGPKIKVNHGEEFLSSCDKSMFKHLFQYIGDEVAQETETKEIVEENKTEVKETLNRNEVEKLYIEKFGKRPFRGWSIEDILAKING